jgi:hypothetical protein
VNGAQIVADYLECAAWCGYLYLSEDSPPVNIDETDYTFSASALASALADCEAFMSIPEVQDCVTRNGLSAEMVGHNYWLTRNRHGAGFWDRGLGADGDTLTHWAHTFGESDPYLSDSEEIELS